MATHSSVLAWRIPGTGEPGGPPSMGSHSWTRLKRLSSSSSNSFRLESQSVNFDITDSMALIKFHGCVIISEAFQDC